jgi:hypothetical protein
MTMSGIARATFSRVPVVAALALVLALAACGGGEEGGSEDQEGASKQEFIRKADAICAHATEKRNAYYQEHPEIGGQHFSESGFAGAIAKYAATMKPVFGDALTKLKELEVPRADEETIEAMLAKFEQAFTRIDDVAAAGRKGERGPMESSWEAWGRTAIEGQNIAFKYGSKQCARFGNP